MSSRPGSDQMKYRLALLFIILALCMASAGYLFSSAQKQHIKRNIQDESSAVNQAQQVTLVSIFLITAISLGFVLWWRKKAAGYARKQYEAELASKMLSQRYEFLSRYANDIILLCDPEGNLLEANDRAVAAYGYTRDELLRLSLGDLHSPETRPEIPGQMRLVREHTGMTFETVHQRKDGEAFPVEVSSRLIDSDGKSFFQSIVHDTTERIKAEIALINEKNRSEAVIAAIGDGISIQDRDFKVLYQNRIHRDMIGDHVGEYCYQAYEHVNETCEGCAMSATFKDGMIHTAERSASTGRRIIHMEITTSPLKNESGEIVAGIEAVRDISSRKKTEMRLSMLNECLLSFGPDPDVNINRLVAICGAQLDATCALYNRLEGDTLYALGQWNTPPDFEPRDKPEGHICFDVIKQGGQDVCVIRDLPTTPYAQTDPNVVRYGLKTYIGKAVSFGGVFVGSLCVVYQIDPLPVEDDLKFLQIVASAIGVEENRKRTINALLESENRYKRLVKSVTDYIVTINVENGRAVSTYHGPGCVTVTGYTSNEYQADPDLWYRMIFDGDRNTVIEQTNALLSGAPAAPFEHRIIHKDGSLRWVRHTPVPRIDGQGRVITVDGLITDITQLKLLESQLRQSQKMEAVGQLAGGIAHDFNNILTAIIGYSHLLLMKMKTGNPDRPYVEHIIASSERAAHLTQSLLAFSRKQVIDLKPVNLNGIIRRTEHLLGRVIGEDIEFKTMLAEEGLPVLADGIHIEQVLMNLAANARDAMPNGGIFRMETGAVAMGEDFIRAHSYGRPGKYACLSITDTGTGMDDNISRRIFEPFFTTKEVGKGTGLGLSMVYGIIKQHHGYIDVYSKPGEGTTFKIFLPLLAAAAIESPAPVPAEISRGMETVLLAEDDKTVRDLARHVLENSGYQVIEAADGEEAVQRFFENGNRIDLLVFDIIMPKRSGKEAYLEIKKNRPDIKALFMSGYTADLVYKKGILETGLDFVLKPIGPTDLLKKVREILDRR